MIHNRTLQSGLHRLSRRFTSFASVNGIQASDPAAVSVSIYDESFQRGDGVFEVIRVLDDGKPRALNLHLDRLERSANAIHVPLPPREVVADWIRTAAKAGGCGCVRLMATKGASNPDEYSGPRVFIVWQPLPSWPKTFRLHPMIAPWHAAGMEDWGAVKWLSYSVNLHSTRLAKCNGYDDALLLAKPCVRNDPKGLDIDDQAEEYGTIKHLLDANVLDGPNFCIGWLQNGTLHFPDWKLNGLVQSTSQVLATKAASDVLGMPVSEGVFTLGNALRADEMFVMSSTRGVIRVESVGTVEMPDKSYSGALANAMNEVANSM